MIVRKSIYEFAARLTLPAARLAGHVSATIDTTADTLRRILESDADQRRRLVDNVARYADETSRNTRAIAAAVKTRCTVVERSTLPVRVIGGDLADIR